MRTKSTHQETRHKWPKRLVKPRKPTRTPRDPDKAKAPPVAPGFGDRLRKLREDLGVTRRRLAKEVRASYTSVSQWEREKITPSIAFIEALARALGVSREFLEQGISGEAESPDPSPSPEQPPLESSRIATPRSRAPIADPELEAAQAWVGDAVERQRRGFLKRGTIEKVRRANNGAIRVLVRWQWNWLAADPTRPAGWVEWPIHPTYEDPKLLRWLSSAESSVLGTEEDGRSVEPRVVKVKEDGP